MTLIFKQIFVFFKLLNSENDTRPLATGLALGVVLGFSPLLSLQGVLILMILFLFRIQMGAAFLSAFFFSFVAFLLDPITDHLGRWILENQHLRPLFISMYNTPFVPLTRFNNSIVMGSALLSLGLVIPLFFLFKSLIEKYRATVVARFKQTKIWKLWTATSLYKFYCKYDELYG